METEPPHIRAAIIIRLSRDDLRTPGSLEEKALRHEAIARELAERHGLVVSEDYTFRFLALTGRKLIHAPEFVRFLTLCETGAISHVVTAYSDRLLRGDKHAEATIEDALLAGEVTLIASDTVMAFDDEYDSRHALTFEVKAAAARQYLRDVIKKLKESNRQRQQKGQRSAGVAGYGYKWVTARYEDRTLVDPPHYEIVGTLAVEDASLIPEGMSEAEYLALARRQGQPGGALLPGVVCTEGEYRIVCEIFRRIRTEGYLSLCKSFNERGIPPSGMAKFRPGYASPHWHFAQVRQIVNNRFYAGFPAHTITTDRKGKKVNLRPDQWILPEVEQTYPHPIRLPEMETLLLEILQRKAPGAGRLSSPAFLTGLLYCSAGRKMRGEGDRYGCPCWVQGNPHPGGGLSLEVAHRLTEQIFLSVIDRLPEKELGTVRAGRGTDQDALIQLLAEIRKKQAALEQLQQHAAMFQRAGASEGLAATVDQARCEIELLQAQARKQQESSNQQRKAISLSRVAAIRKAGAATVWQNATGAEKRAILSYLIERLDTVAPESAKQWIKEVGVVMHPWIAVYYNPGVVKTQFIRRPKGLRPASNSGED